MADLLVYCRHPEAREQMARAIEGTEFVLHACASLEEFRANLTVLQPLLAILDYRFPEGDAFAFIRNLREDPATRYLTYVVKVVPSEAPVFENTSQGINDFLLVPFADAEFLALVRKFAKIGRRKPFQALIRLRTGREEVTGKTVNISPTGVLVQAPVQLKPGDTLEVGFYLPRTRMYVRNMAMVKRRAGERIEQIPCYGLELLNMPQEFVHRLEEFVK
jgi:CheY-like chemotaxis protein